MRHQSKKGWFYFSWNHGRVFKFHLVLGKLQILYERPVASRK